MDHIKCQLKPQKVKKKKGKQKQRTKITNRKQ